MAARTFKRIGPIYKAMGITTSGELIANRVTSAQKAFDGITEQTLPTLVRTALGLSKVEEAQSFVAHFSKDDPAFDPQPGDREVAGLASAIIWELIEGSKSLGPTTALLTTTAGFGGTRKYVDGELQAFAESTLSGFQAADRPMPPTKSTYMPKPKTKEDFDVLDQRGPGNQLHTAYANLKNVLESGFSYTENGLKDLAGQLLRIVENQKRLDEEMSIHWWIVGAWSKERGASFGGLDLPEAIVRSAKELADMTSSDLGLASAPGMFDVVLKAGRTGKLKPLKIGDVATSASLEWRKGWAGTVMNNAAVGSLLPLALATSFAVDTADAADWKPRFQRATGISPDAELSAIDAAVQLYREHLLFRSL